MSGRGAILRSTGKLAFEHRPVSGKDPATCGEPGPWRPGRRKLSGAAPRNSARDSGCYWSTKGKVTKRQDYCP